MEPPYFAVIFTSVRTPKEEGYAEMAQKMEELASQQPGFLGVESARSGLGITVSYWSSEQAILAWKQQVDHLRAQSMGIAQWYASYRVRICRVERDYAFEKEAVPEA